MCGLGIDRLVDHASMRKLAGGFALTEGPTWHPAGFFFFFSDLRAGRLYQCTLDGQLSSLRDTAGGNGTTLDAEGRLIQCETKGRRLTRAEHDGRITTLLSHYRGGRLNRPNDVICASDGSIFFTDPAMRLPYADRDIPRADWAENVWEGSGIYRLSPEGDLLQLSRGEYPNGLALSPDERTLYVANTRAVMYVQAIELNSDGTLRRRRIFADLNSQEPGHPDGIKVDQEGNVLCTGPGGIWILDPTGERLGVLTVPEVPYNMAFGGPDLRTLLITAQTSVYTVTMTIPGCPLPFQANRLQCQESVR